MFRKIIYLFVFYMLVLCGVSFAGRMSADELSAMMAEDVKIAQELINEMPAKERMAMVEKLSANYNRLCGEVAEELEKAYAEDRMGRSYVPAIPMVLENAWRWRDADEKVNGVILKNIGYILDPIWQHKEMRGANDISAPGWYLGCAALDIGKVSWEKIVNSIASISPADNKRDEKSRLMSFVLIVRNHGGYNRVTNRLQNQQKLFLIERKPDAANNIELAIKRLKNAKGSRMAVLGKELTDSQSIKAHLSECGRDTARQESENCKVVKTLVRQYNNHHVQISNILEDNLKRAVEGNGNDHAYGSPLHATMMAVDCWNVNNIGDILLKQVAYRVDMTGHEGLSPLSKYPALRPLERLELPVHELEAEIRRSQNDEKTRLLLFLLSRQTPGGSRALLSKLKQKHYYEQSVGKTNELDNAIKILENVLETEGYVQ